MILNTLNVVSDGYLPNRSLEVVSRGYLWLYIAPEQVGDNVGGGSLTLEEVEELFAEIEIHEEELYQETSFESLDVAIEIDDIENDLDDLNFDI